MPNKMNATLRLFAIGSDHSEGKFIFRMTDNPESIEYNIYAIDRFCGVDFTDYRQTGVKLFRVLNFMCLLMKIDSFNTMYFLNPLNDEDVAYNFFRTAYDLGDNLMKVFYCIRDNYNESDGVIEFLEDAN
jgi:hypothetical protein